MILRTFSLYDILGNSTLHKINIKDLKKNWRNEKEINDAIKYGVLWQNDFMK
jgi:hypothetical protein